MKARGMALDADEDEKMILSIKQDGWKEVGIYRSWDQAAAAFEKMKARGYPVKVMEDGRQVMSWNPPVAEQLNAWGQTPKQAKIARRQMREQRRNGRTPPRPWQ